MLGAWMRGLISFGLCLFGMATACPAQIWITQPQATPLCGCAPTTAIRAASIAPQPIFYDTPPPVFYDYGHGYGPSGPVSPQRSCPPWRPCGPKQSFGSNWLFRQGYAGADFRPACARHDDCLASGMSSRYACDRQFLWDLDAACCCSSRPWLCRFKARQYYLGVRLFGWMY